MVRFVSRMSREQLAGRAPEVIGQGVSTRLRWPVACRRGRVRGGWGWCATPWFDLPQTFAQLAQGTISERVAEHVVSETRHLDAEQRRAVDAAVNAAAIEKMGVRAAAQCARKHAYESPPGRLCRARPDRAQAPAGVRPRSAPDTTVYC